MSVKAQNSSITQTRLDEMLRYCLAGDG
jgi:hypothetical protein